MKLIEDLGKRPVGLQGRVKRFGLFECPKCFENFECVMDNFRSKHTTKCRKCADKESAITRSLEASGNFEEECNRVHNNRYNYFLVNYVNNHTIVKTWYFLLGAHALEKEQEILRLYREFKYTGEPLLSSGNTELFLKDVLGIITQ